MVDIYVMQRRLTVNARILYKQNGFFLALQFILYRQVVLSSPGAGTTDSTLCTNITKTCLVLFTPACLRYIAQMFVTISVLYQKRKFPTLLTVNDFKLRHNKQENMKTRLPVCTGYRVGSGERPWHSVFLHALATDKIPLLPHLLFPQNKQHEDKEALKGVEDGEHVLEHQAGVRDGQVTKHPSKSWKSFNIR